MQEQELYLLALTAVQRAGPATIKKIMNFFGDAKRPFSASRNELLQIEGLSEIVADEILKMKPEKEADRILEDAGKADVHILTMLNEDFPLLLKEIYDPPPVLYCRGKIDENMKIAIVGTRRASPYGKLVAETLGMELASNGITVVSGLARGIDTAAHKGALEGGGQTIAILGCGFNHLYPRENRKLAEKISENGAVITEFSLDVQPLPENFPRRNRIISGLSVATIVVEAEEKSGALITANYALEQGREVLAVPGNITSSKSLGPNRLIKDGATPVIDGGNILNELPLHLMSGLQQKESEPFSPQQHLNLRAPLRKEVNLDHDETEILSHLTVDNPIHIDRIADLSRMSINRLLAAILSLEIKDLVDQLPGSHYIRKLKR